MRTSLSIVCCVVTACSITWGLVSPVFTARPAAPPLPEDVATASVPIDVSPALPVVINPTVIDGDTIRGDVLLPWGITLRDETIRAADFDAWESSRRRRSVDFAHDEITRGKAAAEYLRAITNGCPLYLIPVAESRGVYGRLLARWYLLDSGGHLVSIADLMRDRGHVR